MEDLAAQPKLADLATIKALAHPRRQRIMDHLAQHGPATSATLARALNLNTGATSYHLRELASHDLIEEAPDHAHGRERWWRPKHADIRFPHRSKQDDETRAALDTLAQLALNHDVAEFHRSAEQLDPADPWADAFPYSRGQIRVTPAELAAFFEDYLALLRSYDRPHDDPTPDTRVIITRFLAFPAPTDEPS